MAEDRVVIPAQVFVDTYRCMTKHGMLKSPVKTSQSNNIIYVDSPKLAKIMTR